MLPLLPLLLCAVQEPAPLPASGPEPVDLKVLYAGRADSARSERFADFLAGHFREVGRTDYSSYTPADADGYDVVVLDCEVIPDGRTIGMAPSPRLPRDYDRATVVVAGTVLAVERSLDSKLDWL